MKQLNEVVPLGFDVPQIAFLENCKELTMPSCKVQMILTDILAIARFQQITEHIQNLSATRCDEKTCTNLHAISCESLATLQKDCATSWDDHMINDMLCCTIFVQLLHNFA